MSPVAYLHLNDFLKGGEDGICVLIAIQHYFYIILQTKSSCISHVGLRMLPQSPSQRWRFSLAGWLCSRCQFGFAALCQGRWGGGGGGAGSLQGERGKTSSPASQSLSCCWHGCVHGAAITSVSGSLQRFSFLPSLILHDTVKALELRRRRLDWELYKIVLKLFFSWIFGPISQLQYKATARELRWKSAKYCFC